MLATRGHFSSDLVVGVFVGRIAANYCEMFDQVLPHICLATWVDERHSSPSTPSPSANPKNSVAAYSNGNGKANGARNGNGNGKHD